MTLRTPLLAAGLFAASAAFAGDHLIIEELRDSIEVRADGRTTVRTVQRVRVADNEGVPLVYGQFQFNYLQKVARRKDFSCKRRDKDGRGDSYFRAFLTKINTSSAGNITDEVAETPGFSRVVQGDVIECETVVEHDDVQFAGRYTIDSEYPVQRRRIEVSAEEPGTLVWGLVNGAPEPRKEGDKLVWELAQVPAFPALVAGQYLRHALRAVHLGRARINFFGTNYAVASWGEVADWGRKITEPRLAGMDDALRAKAAELTAKAKTDREKASRIYDWVRDEHRYVAVELGKGGWEPRPPTETARNKYGDCKDFATLFIAMARAAGLKAAIVDVRTRGAGPLPESFSQPLMFNHMIAAVRLDSEWVYADATHKYLPLGILPREVEGTRALLIPDGGEAMLVTLPVSSADDNQQIWTLRAEAGADGLVRLTGSHLIQGGEAGDWRASMDSADSRTDLYGMMQRTYARMLTGAQSVELGGHYQDVHKPVRVEMTATLGGLVQADGGKLYIRLLPTRFEHDVLSGTPASGVPIRLGRRSSSLQSVRWKLPAGVKPVAIPLAKVESPFGRLLFSAEVEDGDLVVHREFVITRDEITPEEMPAYKAFLLKAMEIHGQYYEVGAVK